MIRVLADYLLHVHLECSYIAFQAAAYLMDRSVLSEIYNVIKWSACSQSKARATELVLSKHELQAELSEEESGKLVEVHLKWRKCKIEMLGLISTVIHSQRESFPFGFLKH